jgi:predicted phosphate transport protein (TIGR00153 family)
MFGLIPKEEKFFVMFKDMAQIIVDGAHLLKAMLDDFDNPAEFYHKIKDTEHKGDLQTHEIIRKLNKSFITPFDREDIYSLASGLDDILDLIDASSKCLSNYNVKKITPEAKELGFIILKSCEMVYKAISLLTGNNKIEHISEFCVEVNSLENEADHVRLEAIGKLFREEKDPIELIKWKEVYETLEQVTDKCEYVANILESVVLKNA